MSSSTKVNPTAASESTELSIFDLIESPVTQNTKSVKLFFFQNSMSPLFSIYQQFVCLVVFVYFLAMGEMSASESADTDRRQT